MSTLIDADAILSENEYWKKLEKEWKAVDLENEIEDDLPMMKPVFSTLDLKTTFDSSFLFKKVTKKIGRQLSKKSTGSALDYKDFINNLKDDPQNDSSNRFYFINGQITSAASIEDICHKIDDIFKSIEQLSSATNTMKKKDVPDVVQCSISATDLSFDDTLSEEDNIDNSDIDRHIEEAFEEFSETMSNLSVEQSLDSVTTLVRKFSNVLNSPSIQCSPRRRRECCDKFRELAEFWQNRAFDK
ncbi:unnamed protein product [Danaus chrysippus]|uniref:(African queen) hypothetical protein n=1 Tax=Danaus chrysippus TaxID=151541 RepID=A0A8J2R8V5_9NEOP|nr:unnamed protein product [Danaus chrysippus]